MPLFLFTGEESYLLHAELMKRKNSFIEKYGEHGFSSFPSDALDLKLLGNTLMSGGMFSTKRLLFIRGVPVDTLTHNKTKASDAEAVQNLLEQRLATNDADTIVACISYKPDKRTKPYKRFASHATLKEFAELEDDQKAALVEQLIPGLLNSTQKQLLITTIGENTRHLANECNKLKRYATAHHLTALTDEQITDVVRGVANIDNFTILDNLYTNPTKTLQLITKAQNGGTDIFLFLGMLYRGLKLTLQIMNLKQNGVTDSKQIISILKAHPFAVNKQLKVISTLQGKEEKITALYSDILQLDYEIKTGILPAEGFRIALKQAVSKMS